MVPVIVKCFVRVARSIIFTYTYSRVAFSIRATHNMSIRLRTTRYFVMTLTMLAGLCLHADLTMAKPLKGLNASCNHDAQCQSAYCFDKKCMIWGDELVHHGPHWGDRICRGHDKRGNNSACCYNTQCCSGWCAFGICSIPSDL